MPIPVANLSILCQPVATRLRLLKANPVPLKNDYTPVPQARQEGRIGQSQARLAMSGRPFHGQSLRTSFAVRPTPLPQPWGELFGPLRTGATDDLVVVGQIGQSLDGRIATESGHSKYINGPAGLDHLHRLRALVDAVVIGVGTALADDPQLDRAAGRRTAAGARHHRPKRTAASQRKEFSPATASAAC